jgi:tRNA 2-thiocytidine biosynthesis protein TtcA
MNIIQEKTDFRGIVKYAYKQMGKAIAEHNMLSEGDKVLIGLSGGLDSLSLLTLFKMRQERIPIDFEITACFVNTDFIKADKEKLIDYCNLLGVKFVIKELSIDRDRINCFWCSWNRRKILFETARDYGCNKVALGHNLDDIVETTLLNLFFNGEISTMKPKVELFAGKLTIIRPLAYLDKKRITYLASKLCLPVMQYECFYGKDSRRAMVKDMVKKLETDYPYIKKNIFGALGRIRKDYLL